MIMFGIRTRNGLRKEIIENDLLVYINTILTLPVAFEQCLPIFKERYSVGDDLYANIVSAFVTRSCVNKDDTQHMLKLIQTPIKKISIYDTIPAPADIDWVVVTDLDHKHEYHYETNLFRELTFRTPPTPSALSLYNEGKRERGFIHEFDSESIITQYDFKRIIEKVPYSRPKKNHIFEVPYNSILIHGSIEEFESIRKITGNPRTFKEYLEFEWKPFYETVKASHIDVEPFVNSLIQEVPEGAKYFK